MGLVLEYLPDEALMMKLDRGQGAVAAIRANEEECIYIVGDGTGMSIRMITKPTF